MQEQCVGSSNDIAARLHSAGLRRQEDAVRNVILQTFADQGNAPNVQALMHALGLPQERGRSLSVLEALAVGKTVFGALLT